ncbi:MAG: magnesium/cobalt transporter CorA [Weeksellaceae bacterium]|nr:magnesium/cobalt transporter CorA [Weeksellaceae bacterium]
MNESTENQRATMRLKAGLPPGSVVFTGSRKVDDLIFDIILYSPKHCETLSPANWQEARKILDEHKAEKAWLNVTGLHDTQVIEEIGNYFSWHKLAIEDIVSVNQRAKLEDHDKHFYIVARMLRLMPNRKIDEEQLSIFLHKNTIVTFQEKPGDVFDSLRNRLIEGKGAIRGRNIDYCLYALLDSVVDQYFVIAESLGDQLEEIEQLVMYKPNSFDLAMLHQLRRELLKLRRAVYPMREVAGRMNNTDLAIFEEGTRFFLRDLHDHCVQVMDNIEIQRDIATGLMDVYMNTVSNRMNEIMKVLTIIATIFIPLTFIAGVYGMNFDNMPELHHPYGYHMVWAVMIAVAVVMLLWFRRKKWL